MQAVVKHLGAAGYSCYMHNVVLHNVNNHNGNKAGIPDFYQDSLPVASRMHLCAPRARRLAISKPFGDFYKANLDTGEYKLVVEGSGRPSATAAGGKAASSVPVRQQPPRDDSDL